MLQCIVHGQSIYWWGKRAVLEIHNSVQCDRKHFKTIYETTNCLSFSNIFGKLIFFVWHNIHDDFIKTHQNTFTHIYIANQWRNFWCFAAFTKRFREVFDFLLDLELSFDFFRFYCCSYGCWFEMTTVKFLWKNIFFFEN